MSGVGERKASNEGGGESEPSICGNDGNERIAPLEAVKDSGEGYEFERTERSEY